MATPISTTLTTLLQNVDEQLLRPDENDFVGREYVRSEIAKFLAVQNRMLVLVGVPGVGKTALAAQLVRENLGADVPYLAHFCGLAGDDNPYQFCDALAQQLYDVLGEGYSLPDTVRKQQVHIQASANINQAAGPTSVKVLTLNIGGMHPREAFRQAVREPLRAYNEQHRAERSPQLVIVIDGLDRAWEWDGGQDGNIVGVLADAQDLPPWVNIICLARPGPAVQSLRTQAGVRVIDLQDPVPLPGAAATFRELNLRDIETFFRERFLAQLPASVADRFTLLLATAGLDTARYGGSSREAFVGEAVAASQGNFLFVRRYAHALRAALEPDAQQPATDPSALLRFDSGTLAGVLDGTYAATLEQVRRDMAAAPNDADADVLAALAIAFAPLNLALLACLTARAPAQIQAALNQHLKAVVTAQGDGDACTYALYHRDFGAFVRRQLARQGRDLDVQAAQRLELSADDDAQVREYSARFRWAHLLRGLDLADAARDLSDAQPEATAPRPPVAPQLDSAARIREQVHDLLVQAQLLRGLATRALDPSQSNATGSWSAALSCLRAAEYALRRSRALVYTRERGWRPDAGGTQAPAELIELERTLVALGDAYSTIARRMDAGADRPPRPAGLILWLHLIWDALVRLPLTLYLLFVLIRQGVRELHIPGALQNLGRGQDWTVARLCVLSVSAYRRARALALARGDDDSYGEVTQRLARLYVLMGAYDAAAAGYEALLARPSTITRAWRQAVWRLELGEVLATQEKSEQAVEVLNSALPVFVRQQAPTQQARTLSALALANAQRAATADARRDARMAATFDDLAIQNCREALAAWQNVTTLQGDESASLDPALAVSGLAHQLWRAERAPRLSDEQRHSIRVLLDGIAERHFPQRFEHPLLRLFRVSAAVFLPAYLLVGLLLAVQLPSDVKIQTQTELTFPPPLVDMTRFPNALARGPASSAVTNDLVAGRISGNVALDIGSFNVLNLTQLAGSRVKLQPSPPPLDPLGATRRLLWIMGFYMLSYTVLGLTVIGFSSPAQFQSRRPGRLILNRYELNWRGPAGQGSLMDAVLWVRQDLRWIVRRLQCGLVRLAGSRAAALAPAQPGTQSIALADIDSLIAIDRRAFGYLLHDFSGTLVRPRAAGSHALLLPGTLMNYAELCDELGRRLHRPARHFSVEIVRSVWGMCFLATLLYALALLALLVLWPGPLNQPMLLGYSLVNLYVVATPGLLIPLLWWFVAQPLGANSHTADAPVPLIATALVGAGLTAGVLLGRIDLGALGMRPDLATPVLAGGFLLALTLYAPPRPLRLAVSLRLPYMLRTLLAIVALAGLVLLGWHTGTTLRWYNALVRGNRLVEQALASGACAANPAGCAPIEQAVASYTQVICLRPGESDGYAFRGFAYLARGDYGRARDDFERALGRRPADDACAAGVAPTPASAQRPGLYANLGAVDTLLARQLPPVAAEPHYRDALGNYASALGLPAGPADCAALAGALARTTPDAAIDLQQRAPPTIAAGQAPTVLQLADACYSRGSALAGALNAPDRQGLPLGVDAIRGQSWRDLAAAIVEYQAVAASDAEAKDRDLAERGEAAAWLAIGQIDQPPVGQPERATALLQAMNAFQQLAAASPADPRAYTGQAWSSIQMGAWGSAKAPLAAAADLDPRDPTYPALQGLAFWLDSTQYPAARKGGPSPGYSAAIGSALERYTHVIEMGGADLPSAYATRSLLNFSLRNSPRPGARPDGDYHDEDYSIWMRQAIADASEALVAADRQRMPAEGQVGYRYWRARMYLVLGLTLQEKSRGLHDWNELAALYSSAYADYTAAAAADRLDARRKIFANFWIPWTYALLTNANHLQLAQEAARAGRYDLARAELALVDARPAIFQKWDKLSVPIPDFHFLHGLVSLGLGMPLDFPNPLLKPASNATPASDAEPSYAAAIKATEDAAIVPQPNADYPDDSRPAIYRAALADLDRLLASPPEGWSPRARAAATRVRALLAAQLAATAHSGSSAAPPSAGTAEPDAGPVISMANR